jgi:hypothetical protein
VKVLRLKALILKVLRLKKLSKKSYENIKFTL